MKNVPLFLESARLYLEKIPNAHIIMCGSGMTTSNQKIKEHFSALFRDKTHLLGVRRDMQKIYAASDIVSSTSRVGETYPLCLLEGMACGAIAVATDVGDTKHMLKNKLGIITKEAAESIVTGWIHAYQRQEVFRDAIHEATPRFERQLMIGQYERFINKIYQKSILNQLASQETTPQLVVRQYP